jgi:hypothetical protein
VISLGCGVKAQRIQEGYGKQLLGAAGYAWQRKPTGNSTSECTFQAEGGLEKWLYPLEVQFWANEKENEQFGLLLISRAWG